MIRLKSKLNIKRSIGLLLVLACLLVGLPARAAESGTCGQNLNWTFDQGTLTITGEGAMTEFNEYRTAPWYHLREQITKVILPDGLTSIGRLAFYGCTALRAVSFPDSLRTIGDSAFYNCEKLVQVRMSSTLSKIGRQAFYGCTSLVFISLPISLESVGDKAFYLCESLVSITLPRYAEKLGTQVFAYCTSLLRVQIDAPIKTVPEWMFYGCENLAEVALPSTVTEAEYYAFKRCDSLTGIYHSGDKNTLNSLRQDISESNPSFAASGYIGNGTLTDTSHSSSLEYDLDGELISQTNTTVTLEEGVTLVTKVESKPAEEGSAGTYTTDLSITVNSDSWATATDAITDALGQVNDTYSSSAISQGTKVTVYTDGSPVDEDFLKEMAGRDVQLEIVTPGGDTWRVDCSGIDTSDVNGAPNYSYTVNTAPDSSRESLGTDNCFGLNFNDSSSLKSEILIRLPDSTANTNAFLYQVESDGSHTRLQASVVDNDGNAHFYLSSVDKDTQYIVGINVPGENTDDVIIPDEMSPVYGAIQRLEHIEYVETGVREMGGLTLADVMLIAIGGLVLVSIIVGIVMFFLNKRKLMNMYSAKHS
ncbi:MAG: leucine-rich repeat domain-containing protein [Clostridia bacterium]|nr:leucine-rich repeat domain-containing protein [Clostridia bacterium]